MCVFVYRKKYATKYFMTVMVSLGRRKGGLYKIIK